ncbi:MAG: VanZ family protein [Chloroflexi bacterium]|nr:VanZ family protein [Chloroflexota bacterium]
MSSNASVAEEGSTGAMQRIEGYKGRLLRWGSVVSLFLWMGLLFYVSSLPQSALPTQHGLVRWLGSALSYVYHFGAYGILGLLATIVSWCWRGGRKLSRGWLLGILCFGVLYSISDELHQSMIPERSASLLDVAVDTAGVVAGVAAWQFISLRWLRQGSVLVLFIPLLLISLAAVAAGGKAAFAQESPVQPEVLSLTLGVPLANPGEPVPLIAQIRNPSDKGQQFTLVLFVDETPVDTRVVTVQARATRTLRFSVVRAQPGTHVVRLGAQATTFQVVLPQFRLQRLVISPQVVSPGAVVTIRAVVENTGAAPVEYQAPLSVNNTLVDAHSGLLPVGGSTVAAFQVSRDLPGTYEVRLGDLIGFFMVAGPDLAASVPTSLVINAGAVIAQDSVGESLPVTGDRVALVASGDNFTVDLPVRLLAGQTLAFFEDPSSGVVYRPGRLQIPLLDDLGRMRARLELEAVFMVPQGDMVRVFIDRITLQLLETVLSLPGSVTKAAPISFQMDASLSSVPTTASLTVTPGLHPPVASMAALELAAQAQGKTVRAVYASAAVELPGSPARGDAATSVVFGAPLAWQTSVAQGSLYLGWIGQGGKVDLWPAQVLPSGSGRVDMEAAFASSAGTFLLVALEDAVPGHVIGLSLSDETAMVGSVVEVLAQVQSLSDVNAATSSLILLIDGIPAGVSPVETLPNDAQGAVFYVPAPTPGVFTLSVASAESHLRIGLQDGLGHIQVSEITAVPAKAAPGQPVEVRATLANVGSQTLLAQANLQVNGVTREERLVPVGAGASVPIAFTLTPLREGIYEVAVLGRRVQFTVAAFLKPAQITASDLTLDNPSVNQGVTVYATFWATNTGDLPGTYSVRVFLNAAEIQRLQLTVEGATQLPVTFPIQPSRPGIYTLEIEGMRRQLVVVSPLQRADLVVEALELAPSTVLGGQPVTATVVIRNRFAQQAVSTLYVLVNNTIVAQEKLDVGPLGRITKTFTFREQAPGFYDVEMRLGATETAIISIYKGQFLVSRAQSQASWEISLLEVLPRPALAGEPVQVSFLLSNLGQQAGEVELVALVNGQVEWQATIPMEAQTTRPVSLALPGRDPGEYTLEIYGITVRFTVIDPLTPGPTGSPTPSDISAEGGLPAGAVAFGVLGAALVLGAGGLGYWFFRRKASAR